MRLTSIDERTVILMKEKLQQAQALLSDVYHYACENEFGGLENQMSVADSCIGDSLDLLKALDNE
jgi:hypothetical protein